MTLSSYISDYLRQHGKVEIMGFGTFVLVKSRAILDADTQTLLPPSQQVNFTLDYESPDGGFINYVAHATDVSLQHVKRDLDVQIDYWKKKIVAKENFTIEGLGDFEFKNDELAFDGTRLEDENPDFYGLEKISLAAVHTTEETPDSEPEEVLEQQKGSRWVLWLFLIIIPIAGLAYFAYLQQDLLFGDKSTKDISVQTATHRIPDAVTDSIQPKQDSVVVDSTFVQDSVHTVKPITTVNSQ